MASWLLREVPEFAAVPCAVVSVPPVVGAPLPLAAAAGNAFVAPAGVVYALDAVSTTSRSFVRVARIHAGVTSLMAGAWRPVLGPMATAAACAMSSVRRCARATRGVVTLFIFKQSSGCGFCFVCWWSLAPQLAPHSSELCSTGTQMCL